jgi:uncharacterized protein YndB with AHSA1/START domain
MSTHDGTLETIDPGHWNLRFERTLPHPPEKVWRALTERDRLAAWFPTTIQGDWTAGSPLRFEFEEHDLPGFDGVVLACEPPKLLEYMWGEDTLRFELEPSSDGSSTRLTLVDTIVELGKAARDGAGWHVKLQELALVVDGATPPFAVDDWRVVNARYIETLGPEASTLGPPEGMLDN